MRFTAFAASLAFITAATPAHAAEDELNVTVTIRPVHALVQQLVEGVAKPSLLITGGASPHSYALKPSDARALARSDLVVRVSPALEVPLNEAIETLPSGAQVVSLDQAPGLTLHRMREGGVWEAHDHEAGSHDHGHEPADEHDRAHGGDGHDENLPEHATGDATENIDAHLWLDPNNARAIVRHLTNVIVGMRPEKRTIVEANEAALLKELDALDAELAAMTKPVQSTPFIVFHDAYQYFEKRYGLNAAGSVTVSPERQPSARRIRALRERIKQADAACVFAEPQFEPRLVKTIVEGSGAKTGVLDPEGTGMPEDSDGYFDLMRALGRNLTACLDRADG